MCRFFRRARPRKTAVSIVGHAFHINGQPTYAGRTWQGHKIEGLLLNSRMVQGIFDDLNPETVKLWAYPDTGKWDAERNTREFLAAMPAWREHGLLAFTINLQGGSPQGYSQRSALAQLGHQSRRQLAAGLHGPAGADSRQGRRAGHGRHPRHLLLRPGPAAARTKRPSSGPSTTPSNWVFDRGYTNVLIEVNNECNVRYDHAILQPDARPRADRAGQEPHAGRPPAAGRHQLRRRHDAQGKRRPRVRLPAAPRQRRQRPQADRRDGPPDAAQVPGYRPMPILFNEDDHFDFDKPDYNFKAAARRIRLLGLLRLPHGGREALTTATRACR